MNNNGLISFTVDCASQVQAVSFMAYLQEAEPKSESASWGFTARYEVTNGRPSVLVQSSPGKIDEIRERVTAWQRTPDQQSKP